MSSSPGGLRRDLPGHSSSPKTTQAEADPVLKAPRGLLKDLEASPATDTIDWNDVESDPESPPREPNASETAPVRSDGHSGLRSSPDGSRFHGQDNTPDGSSLDAEIQRRVAEVNNGDLSAGTSVDAKVQRRVADVNSGSLHFGKTADPRMHSSHRYPMDKPNFNNRNNDNNDNRNKRVFPKGKGKKKSEKATGTKFRCELCNVPVSSEQNLRAHLNGKPHRTRMRQKQISDKMKPVSGLSFPVSPSPKPVPDVPPPAFGNIVPRGPPVQKSPPTNPVTPSVSAPQATAAHGSRQAMPSMSAVDGRPLQSAVRHDQPTPDERTKPASTPASSVSEAVVSPSTVGRPDSMNTSPESTFSGTVGLKRARSEFPDRDVTRDIPADLEQRQSSDAMLEKRKDASLGAATDDAEPAIIRRRIDENPIDRGVTVEREVEAPRPNVAREPTAIVDPKEDIDARISRLGAALRSSAGPVEVSDGDKHARDEASLNNPLFASLVSSMEKMALVSDETVFPDGKKVPREWLEEPMGLLEWQDLRAAAFGPDGSDVDRLAFKMMQEIILSPLLGIRQDLLKPLSRAVLEAAGDQIAVPDDGVFVRLSKLLGFKCGPDPRYREGNEDWIKEQSPEMLAMCVLMENIRFMFSPYENADSAPNSNLEGLPLRGSFGMRKDAHAVFAQMKGRTPRFDDAVGNDGLFKQLLYGLLQRTMTLNGRF